MGSSCSSNHPSEAPTEPSGVNDNEHDGAATPTGTRKTSGKGVSIIQEESQTDGVRAPPSVKNAKYVEQADATSNFSLILQTFRPDEHHIVVVDDDVSTLKSLVRWLQESGYLVSTCGSGQELIDLLNLASTDAELGERTVNDTNVILVDITMQTSQGPVLDQIRAGKCFSHIPVILMGFDVTPQEASRLMRRGSADFLHKPMSSTLLLRSVRLLLEARVEQHNAKVLKKEGDKYKLLAKEGKKNVSISRVSTEPSKSVMFNQQDDNNSILIVDGSASVNEVEMWLASAGYDVTICDTADDAVKLLSEDKAFSLVLCSIYFPNGDLSGPQLMKYIAKHESLSEMPVILIAEEDSTDVRETSQLLRLGAENCIKRPISKELLITKVHQIVKLIAQQNKSTAYLERAAKYKRLYSLLDNKNDGTRRSGVGSGVQELPAGFKDSPSYSVRSISKNLTLPKVP